MENQVNNRLRRLIKKEKLTQKKFCEIIEISWGTLNTTLKRETNPGTDTLIKLSRVFPQYSINWLLTGNGSMEVANTSTEISANDSSPLVSYLKEQIEDLKLKNERLSEQNGYYRGLLDHNGINYKQTAS